MDRSDWATIGSIIASIIIALGAAGWHFIIQKDYRYLIEASCDPSSQTCYVRDCSNEENECPPNGFETYTTYRVWAYDFETCTDETCTYECMNGLIFCEEKVCDESAGETCVYNIFTPEEESAASSTPQE